MNENNGSGMTLETVERQIKYVKEQKSKGKGLGIVFADAFLRGMRDIGYKSPAWSLAEMVDNSFQAAARTVSIRFGFAEGNNTRVKPDFLAVVDDGNGIIPEMISYAVRWGGTDRENDRHGFGRYGYGLPSSAISLAKRYTVYSKTDGGSWNAVTVDLDDLADAAGDIERTEKLLLPKPANLPTWIVKTEDKLNLSTSKSGTVVALEDLDRLRRLGGWIKVDTLEAKLLQHFGVIYRHWVPERRIFVQGTEVQAVDPLFLMEHGKFFDETPVRAEVVETRTIEVETESGTIGKITVRAALLPPNFQLADPGQFGVKGAKNNKRFSVMRDWHGLLVCRERRHIDTILPPWTKFQNNDMNVKIEVDFDPILDELFGITTSKQQIEIDDSMWEKLRQPGRNSAGLYDVIVDIRHRLNELREQLEAQKQNLATEEQPRPSVMAMESSEKFKETVSQPPTEEQLAEGSRNLDQAANELAAVMRRPKQEILIELQEHTKGQKWEIEFAAIPEGPFYRPMRFGEQKRLLINTNHPFYAKMYERSSPEVRAALEVLLFVLAERELESTGDAETFYKAERQKWSERLRHALDRLTPDESMVDKVNAIAEEMHIAVTTEEEN